MAVLKPTGRMLALSLRNDLTVNGRLSLASAARGVDTGVPLTPVFTVGARSNT